MGDPIYTPDQLRRVLGKAFQFWTERRGVGVLVRGRVERIDADGGAPLLVVRVISDGVTNNKYLRLHPSRLRWDKGAPNPFTGQTPAEKS